MHREVVITWGSTHERIGGREEEIERQLIDWSAVGNFTRDHLFENSNFVFRLPLAAEWRSEGQLIDRLMPGRSHRARSSKCILRRKLCSRDELSQ